MIGLFGTASAQSVDGFVEVRGQYDLGVDGVPVLVVERVRPELEAPLVEDRLVLVSTVELASAQGRSPQEELERTLKASDLGPALEAAGCTWPEDVNPWLHVSGASDYLSVERLYADLYTERVDVRVGRQAVNWGSAFVVNPTDPFPEVLLLEPWRPRAGVNAARVTVPFGEDHQVQAVAGADDTFTNARLAGRGTVHALGTDLSLVGAWRQEADDGLVGLDLRGTLGVGFWLEAALHVAQDAYEEVAIGLDWSFPVAQALVVTAQYYRNGAGGPDAAPVATSLGAVAGPVCDVPLFEASEPDRFAPRFRGRDYAIAAVSLAATADVSASALWLQNLGDGTAVFVPTATVAATGWLSVAASASVPVSTWGDGGELRPSRADLVQRIDLGTPVRLDLDGLVPSASFSLWTRVNF